jgi:hypothetical protein
MRPKQTSDGSLGRPEYQDVLDLSMDIVKNRPMGAGKQAPEPGVNARKIPLRRPPSPPKFKVCPVCGIPAKGSSWGIHDECAPVGFVKGLAGDLIDLALGRRPEQLEPIRLEKFFVHHPASHTKKYAKQTAKIVDAEFRVIR